MDTRNHQLPTRRTHIASAAISMTSVFVMLCFIVKSSDAQTSGGTNASVPPHVEIAGTQLLHLASTITHADYDLYINLPRGYREDTTKTFPVLFVIDAQWDFSFVQSLYGQQYYDGFIPGMVIVGITWGGTNPDYDKLRAHDLTPTDVSHNGTYGNAQNFLSFITKEVIPFVEGKYRIRPNDRTLMGSSFGGLFTLYAMFQAPGLFNRFVLTSPAIQWDNHMISTLNKNYSQEHKALPARVFMAIGGYENVGEFQKFVEDLKAKQYNDLVLETRVVDGMGHSGAKADGYSRGLQFVFARPDLRIDPAVLGAYVGQYELNPQYKISVVLEDGTLVGIAPDNSRIRLKAESANDFYLPGQFLNAHIERDATGNVTGITLHQYGGDVMLKKVK